MRTELSALLFGVLTSKVPTTQSIKCSISKHLSIVRSNLIDPQSPGAETFLTPINVMWLENTALRDMALHERHAACVDVRGDVFQWGDGFFGSNSDSKSPKATLRGKVGSISI